MAEITLRRVRDLDALEAPWRELEQRAAGGFFRSWTWTGCLAAERFADPVLLEAREGGRTIALALCNRRAAVLAPATLWLGESGDPRLDQVFVEHNGPLIETGREAVLGPLLAAGLAARLPAGRGPGWPGRALVLGGVNDAALAAARSLPGRCWLRRSRPAPFVDLASLPPGEFAASLGASTRYQLRRSHRLYAAAGTVQVRRAASLTEAQAFLDALEALHQAAWIARGQPGAFADPWFGRFHRALLTRGVARGEIDLLRIQAGERVIGYLYNFLSGGWVGNYQGGFDYAGAHPHQKPGLTCHHLAIDYYRREGRATYDFMAGGTRYKTSLAHATKQLHWLELTPPGSLRGAVLAAAAELRRLKPGTQPG